MLRTVACPNCWREFHPAEVHFVAESPELRGDPVLGPAEQLRFRAMRFDPAGNALDPHEGRCQRVACPSCHVEVPRAVLEVPQLPISVVGSPGSGKTNMLAAATWRLRREAPGLGMQFVDAEPGFNALIHRGESRLFSSADPRGDVTLPKTDVGGADLYRMVRVGGHREMVPRPSYFRIRCADGPDSVLVLYDNAGEHFLPGTASAGMVATRHLERSAAMVLVFDPMQDIRFRRKHAAGAFAGAEGHERQELVLGEAIARVRRLRALDPSSPVSLPIVVAMTKADEWGASALGTGWDALPGDEGPAARRRALAEWSWAMGTRCRTAIAESSPEFLAALDSLSGNVRFVPCSALGCSPTTGTDGRRVIAASSVRPRLAEAPLLVAAGLAEPAVFPELSG